MKWPGEGRAQGALGLTEPQRLQVHWHQDTSRSPHPWDPPAPQPSSPGPPGPSGMGEEQAPDRGAWSQKRGAGDGQKGEQGVSLGPGHQCDWEMAPPSRCWGQGRSPLQCPGLGDPPGLPTGQGGGDFDRSLGPLPTVSQGRGNYVDRLSRASQSRPDSDLIRDAGRRLCRRPNWAGKGSEAQGTLAVPSVSGLMRPIRRDLLCFQRVLPLWRSQSAERNRAHVLTLTRTHTWMHTYTHMHTHAHVGAHMCTRAHT